MNRITKIIAILFILLTSVKSLVAQSYSVSGYITDEKNRETLIGATIQIKGTATATVTDKFGLFSLTGVKKGEYTLIINHLGYKTKELPVTIKNKGLILNEISLTPAPFNLGAVSIVGAKADKVADKTIETSHIELTPQMIRSIPTAGNDVFAAAKYLPGIDRTEPYSPLYTVRGGDPGENAVLLDGVMVYNPYHSSVSSGIFNTMIIKDVDLLAGGFGAEFGGRNSSVMYITTKDGNTNEIHGEIEPSTFYSKIFLESPAGKNASLMVAGRYFYDLPFNFIFQSKNYFYDYNISYTNRLNSRHRLTFKYFESKDYTGYNLNTLYRYVGNTINSDIYDNFNLEQRNDWKNRTATLIHKFIVTPRIFIRNQVYYSHHKSNNLSGLDFMVDIPDQTAPDDTLSFNWKTSSRLESEITDISGKSAITIKIANWNELHAGAQYNMYKFNNGIDINSVNNGTFDRSPDLLSAFIEDKITAGFLTIRPGLRATNYRNSEWLYEPRFNVNVKLPFGLKLKAAYGKYLQYIISMNTNELEMTQIVDYYYPLWNYMPSKAIHYIAGLQKNITPALSLSVDAYYKKMPEEYAFDMNNFFGFSDKLMAGTGRAYGLEVLLEGKINRISGWISYSYAKAWRQFPNSQINDGKEFPFEYNRPHTFKSVASYQITPNFALNGSLVILSGAHRSIETTEQSFYYYDPVANQTSSFPMWTTNDKNNARMPPVINFDLGIKKKLLYGFGRQLADLIHADESFVTVTIRNILFMYRNVDFYIPGRGIPGYEDKYIPLGSNYKPSVGVSYTLKF